MPENQEQFVSLPFSLFTPKTNSQFVSKSKIIFGLSGTQQVQSGIYIFENGSLVVDHSIAPKQTQNSTSFAESDFPVASFMAIVLLIIFRNRFYPSFMKYFFSLSNNYEIDFNFQKIGLGPVLIAVSIIFLGIYDLIVNFSESIAGQHDFTLQTNVVILVFVIPIIFSSLVFFLLDFSGKVFPLIFSDIKVLFFLILFVLMWNFSVFGAHLNHTIPIHSFLFFIAATYLIFRSFILYWVFTKGYRFQKPITLFYICTLNFTTFLFLTKGLTVDIFYLL